MAEIQCSTTINSPVDRVWEVVSDIDNEPKFWKGTKQVKNITKEENRVTREIVIAFKDSKCMQDVIFFPKEKIQATFTKGIIKGTKTLELKPIDGSTKVQVIWDIKLSGMMGMFTGIVKKHIKNGTEQALESIKQEIESMS